MNEELIKQQIDTHKCRIVNHSERLDKLEQRQAAFAIQIETLCSDLKGLTGVLKWLVGVMITSLIGFFIYMVQSGLIR